MKAIRCHSCRKNYPIHPYRGCADLDGGTPIGCPKCGAASHVVQVFGFLAWLAATWLVFKGWVLEPWISWRYRRAWLHPVKAPPIKITSDTAGWNGGTLVLRGTDMDGQPIEERLEIPPPGGVATSTKEFRSIGEPASERGGWGEAYNDLVERGLTTQPWPHGFDLEEMTLRANCFHRRAQRAERDLVVVRRAHANLESLLKQRNDRIAEITEIEKHDVIRMRAANEHARYLQQKIDHMTVLVERVRRNDLVQREIIHRLSQHVAPMPEGAARCGDCPHISPGPEQDFCGLFNQPLVFVQKENGSYIRLDICRERHP